MTQYLLSNIHPTGAGTLDPDLLRRAIQEINEVTRQMQSAGVWVFSMPLTDPSSATVVSSDADGVTLADGPFAELKEYVGGITVIDVTDLDAATAWAGKVSAALQGLKVEVRPAPSLGA